MHQKKTSGLVSPSSKNQDKGKITFQSIKSLSSAQRMLAMHKTPEKMVPSIRFSEPLTLARKQERSNYEQFMGKQGKADIESLPSCFKLIKIVSRDDKYARNNYGDINFDILACSSGSLIAASAKILDKFGLGQLIGVSGLSKLVRQISEGYNVISYHNFAHAFSLMHMFYQLVSLDAKFKSLFSMQQIGFILIAALGHDLGHKGTNNAYENKLNSQLSRQANKQSVLQKMHIGKLLNLNEVKNLLKKSKHSVKMKETMVRAILSTDVAKHFGGVQKIKQLRIGGEFDAKNIEHRHIALENAFHACDIGNPCLQFQHYMNWAALLAHQFDTQAKLQIQKGVQVSQMLKYRGVKQFYQGQIGFINALVMPLWKQLYSLWPGMQLYYQNVETNLDQLRQTKEKLANGEQ